MQALYVQINTFATYEMISILGYLYLSIFWCVPDKIFPPLINKFKFMTLGLYVWLVELTFILQVKQNILNMKSLVFHASKPWINIFTNTYMCWRMYYAASTTGNMFVCL